MKAKLSQIHPAKVEKFLLHVAAHSHDKKEAIRFIGGEIN